MGSKVVAIVGSYRRGGTIDTAVEAVLAGARAKGAETSTIYLTDRHIEFCTNCRTCVRDPGEARGKCPQQDDLEAVLTEIEAADSVVLGSSVNDYNVTAIFRRFMERTLGYAYWPWRSTAPRARTRRQPRKAVLVASAAMPAIFIPFATGAARALRLTAKVLGARTVGNMWIGLVAYEPHYALSKSALKRAQRLGWKLA